MLTDLKLQPLANVQKSNRNEFIWESLNDDPQFLFEDSISYAGQWVCIDFVISIEQLRSHSNAAVTFYFDTGLGFNQLQSITAKYHNKKIQHIFKVPVGTTSIRFDPHSENSLFSFDLLNIKKLTKFDVLLVSSLGVIKLGKYKVILNSVKLCFKKTIKSAAAYLINEFNNRFANDLKDYQSWIFSNESNFYKNNESFNKIKLTLGAPKFSILMATYNTPIDFLQRAINSVVSQIYTNWELCIADDASTDSRTKKYLKEVQQRDPRIKVVFKTDNGHISRATNAAIGLATGDFFAFMDHDDELHSAALLMFAKEIIKNPRAVFFYSDEDKIDEKGRRFEPHFKSDFNYELLLTQNMICHLTVCQADLVRKLGGLNSEYDGAQDYDFVLRATENLSAQQIVHIPQILYHWRVHSESTAHNTDAKPYAVVAGRKAVSDHLVRVGSRAKVVPHPDVSFWNKVTFDVPEKLPLIEIVIPTRDRIDLMQMCIKSILEKSSYSNFHITIVDNGSLESQTFQQFKLWSADSRIKIIRDDSPFNYSRLNNDAVNQTEAEYICLLNNDIEIITPNWIEEMISHAARPGVGCVGARLWYPDNTLQHGGVILGIGGVAGHSHKYINKGNAGYFGRAVSLQALSAVTAAALVIKRSTYQLVNGLDEVLQVAFNDVDFCLRVRSAGFRNVWTPFAEMYHHESASRGQEDNPVKAARFKNEVMVMQERWGDALIQDPYYSPNLTIDHENFSLALHPRIGAI